ncbi:hypothetical protein [Clostridium facile]|uniref:Uncharacterized protein n=1 Tax=Clostridium facile TaxID=2763035 RepID=A0ABR7INH9_9CLOT|nr:hypothetical protein [Clostridium facile]MBC5786666.1 hypothetical protein [Clostridium facile]
MKQKLMHKIVAFILAQCMFATVCVATGSAVENQQENFSETIENILKNPKMEQKVGARWWLAEGSHTDETLIESIDELYGYGFGSVEVVTLDESAYLDDATYAWGSKEWVEDTQLILDECTKRDMGVSFTSGTNW